MINFENLRVICSFEKFICWWCTAYVNVLSSLESLKKCLMMSGIHCKCLMREYLALPLSSKGLKGKMLALH